MTRSNNRGGMSPIEWGLIIALIAVIIITAVTVLEPPQSSGPTNTQTPAATAPADNAG